MRYKDIKGQKFGKLTAIHLEYIKNGRAYWSCLCECGKSKIVLGKNLRSGATYHCGCLTSELISKARINKIDLVGNTYGRLTVIEKLEKFKRNRTYYRCKCSCGNETIVYGGSLSNGETKSCGCIVSEKNRVDISGKRFTKLVAIKPVGTNNKQNVVWQCQCDCGNLINCTTVSLTSGNTKSCGCIRSDIVHSRLEDLTNKRFGRLIVKKLAYIKNRTRYWECLCDCGKTTYTTSNCLNSGHTRSCGCLNKEQVNVKHNMAHKAPIYAVWKELRARCNNPNHKSYINYGGRGISVCSEWDEDFLSFYNWSIENGYKKDTLSNGKNKLTIDRIDNNGNYEPSNCRWVTNKQQANNKRNNVTIEYKGEIKTLTDWCNELSLDKQKVYNRIHSLNWSVEKAFETQ